MPKLWLGAAVALGLSAGGGFANEISDGGIVLINVSSDTVLKFEPVEWPREVAGITIRITGPTGARERGGPAYDVLVETGTKLPAIDLKEFGELEDGPYGFEITGTTGEKIKLPEKQNDGRNRPAEFTLLPFRLTGSLLVDGGQIIRFEQFEEKETQGSKPGEESDDTDEGRGKGEIVNRGRGDVEDKTTDGDEKG